MESRLDTALHDHSLSNQARWSRLRVQHASTTAISSGGKRTINTTSNNIARQPARMPENTNTAAKDRISSFTLTSL